MGGWSYHRPGLLGRPRQERRSDRRGWRIGCFLSRWALLLPSCRLAAKIVKVVWKVQLIEGV